MISPAILSLAENANTHSPVGPNHERIENECFVLWMGPSVHPAYNVVQRLRLTPESIDATIADVHALLHERGRAACSWEVGSSATPANLIERLRERGLVDDADPDVAAMVLPAPPPPAPAGNEARPVRNVDEYIAAKYVADAAFAKPPEPDWVERWRDGWAQEQEFGRTMTFAALLDGRIVAHATSTYTAHGVTLNGGATLPDARAAAPTARSCRRVGTTPSSAAFRFSSRRPGQCPSRSWSGSASPKLRASGS